LLATASAAAAAAMQYLFLDQLWLIFLEVERSLH